MERTSADLRDHHAVRGTTTSSTHTHTHTGSARQLRTSSVLQLLRDVSALSETHLQHISEPRVNVDIRLQLAWSRSSMEPWIIETVLTHIIYTCTHWARAASGGSNPPALPTDWFSSRSVPPRSGAWYFDYASNYSQARSSPEDSRLKVKSGVVGVAVQVAPSATDLSGEQSDWNKKKNRSSHSLTETFQSEEWLEVLEQGPVYWSGFSALSCTYIHAGKQGL